MQGSTFLTHQRGIPRTPTLILCLQFSAHSWRPLEGHHDSPASRDRALTLKLAEDEPCDAPLSLSLLATETLKN